MTKSTIPLPRLPTDEELQASAQRWLKPLRPCLYENWPSPLKSLSFRTCVIELSQTEIRAILDTFDEKYDVPILAAFEAKIDAVAAGFDEGFYAKLSSRSPKDSFHAFNHLAEFRCRTGRDVLNLFSGSERILDDLCRYRRLDISCNLLLREYQQIPPQEEWRCFIRKGKIAGVSQYFHREHFPALAADHKAIAARCFDYLESTVLPMLHIDTVVVDIWLRDEPMVIEINPYGLSDPCLLSYPELERNGPSFFRIVEASTTDGVVVA
jgi:hypothetical protein